MRLLKIFKTATNNSKRFNIQNEGYLMMVIVNSRNEVLNSVALSLLATVLDRPASKGEPFLAVFPSHPSLYSRFCLLSQIEKVCL